MRYILALMKPGELREAQLQWVAILESKLLQDNCFEVYTLNARIVSHILKSLIERSSINFVESDLK